MSAEDDPQATTPPAAPTPKPAKPAATPSPKPKAASAPAPAASPPTPKPAKKEVKEEKAAKKEEGDDAEGPRAPRRAALSPAEKRLLTVRGAVDQRRPLFVRTASHRYHRIGRWHSWRRPRGLQSKQRRHYGYRPTVVSVGFRSPARIRGLTPAGFRTVLVNNAHELEQINAAREAAVIAHSVGVRKRLLLEETARKKGIHVLNPILKEEADK